MEQRIFALVAMLAASVFALGCPAESSDDNHQNAIDCSFAACGGELVGTWTIDGACPTATGTEAIPECSDAVYEGPEPTGTITFDADGTYTRDTQVAGTVRSVLDDDCIAALSGGAATGEQYCTAQNAAAQAARTGSCTYASGKCTCNLTLDVDTDSSGNYSTANATVTMSGAPSDYCVEGNELKVMLDGTLVVLSKDDGGTGGSGGTGGTGGTGGNEPGLCEESFEACGGNLAGEWTVAGTCGIDAMDFGDDPACRNVPVQVSVSATGTIAYASGTQSMQLNFTRFDQVFTLPGDCAEAIGEPYGMTAARLCEVYDTAYGERGVGSCSMVGAGCHCELDLSGVEEWDAPYVVRGTEIVIDEGAEDEFRLPFCVDGGTLRQDWSAFVLVLTE